MSGQPLLARVAELCVALAEAEREDSPPHAAFRVRGRTFAYFVEDHHGDGIVGIHAKTRPGENEALIDAHPDRYFMPAYLGARGWVGLRLDAGEPDWREVEDVLTESYVQVAPKTLARRLSA